MHSESRGARELVKVLEDKQLHRDVSRWVTDPTSYLPGAEFSKLLFTSHAQEMLREQMPLVSDAAENSYPLPADGLHSVVHSWEVP